MSVSDVRRRRGSSRTSVARRAVVSVVGRPAVTLAVIMGPTMLTSSCLLFLLPPLALASESESPRVNPFSSGSVLVPRKASDAASSLIGFLNSVYNFPIDFFPNRSAPGEKVPRTLLESGILDDPKKHIMDNLGKISRDFSRLFLMAATGLFLAVMVPFLMLIACCCRCCCRCCCCCADGCGGGYGVPEEPQDPFRRCCCGLLLFFVLNIMLFTLFCAFVTNFYIPLGIDGLLPQAHRTIRDVQTLYAKTKREVEFILVENYAEFQKDMFLKLESCVKASGQAFTEIFGDTTFAGINEVTKRITDAAATLKKVSDYQTELNTLVASMYAMETRVRGHLGSTFTKCGKTPGNLPAPDCVKIQLVENMIVSSNPGGQPWVCGLLYYAENCLVSPETIRNGVLFFGMSASEKLFELRLRLVYGGNRVIFVTPIIGHNRVCMILPRLVNVVGKEGTTMLFRDFVSNLVALDPSSVQFFLDSFLSCPILFVVLLVGVSCGLCLSILLSGKGSGCCGGTSRHSGGSRGTARRGASPQSDISEVSEHRAQRTRDYVLDQAVDHNGPDPRLPEQAATPELSAVTKDLVRRDLVIDQHVLDHSPAGARLRLRRSRKRSSETHKQYMARTLLGEQLVRNITHSMGQPWNLTWIVDGGGPIDFKADIAVLATVPVATPPLDSLEPGLASLRAIDFSGVLNVPDYRQQAQKPPLVYKLPAIVTDLQSLITDPALQPLHTDLQQGRAELTGLETSHDAFQAKLVELQKDLTAMENFITINGSQFGVYLEGKIRESIKFVANVTENVQKMRMRSDQHKKSLAWTMDFYLDHVREQIRENIGDCRPAHAMYKGVLNSVCTDILLPFVSMVETAV
ncbi:unnamed protein product [Ixodes hexagonus]